MEGSRTLRSPGPARGVLPGEAPDGVTKHQRALPEEELVPFVAHFWTVEWALRAPFLAETLPHPSVHVVFEDGEAGARAEVAGVHSARFSRHLVGDGWVFGVKFRPAAFSSLIGAPVATLTDRVVPIENVFGEEGSEWARAVRRAPTFEERVALSSTFLARRVTPLVHDAARARDLVERLAIDRSLVRVEDAAMALSVDMRALQRWFLRYVGVSPKWVLKRYRLHEAAEQLKGASPPVARRACARSRLCRPGALRTRLQKGRRSHAKGRSRRAHADVGCRARYAAAPCSSICPVLRSASRFSASEGAPRPTPRRTRSGTIPGSPATQPTASIRAWTALRRPMRAATARSNRKRSSPTSMRARRGVLREHGRRVLATASRPRPARRSAIIRPRLGTALERPTSSAAPSRRTSTTIPLSRQGGC